MAVGGYSAGNLEFEIQAMSNNTTASLSKMNKGLKTSALSIADIVNKVYFLRNYTKQMFRDLKGILQKAVDYTETLNLWQVAMRGNREEAEEFIKTMNRAYGISTQTLMNYQAIFKNMLSSLGGISGDVSYALSEYLTQMALDYASLYNTSIEKAMTTFQSVLSGQVRPIRSIAGYDITETTIYQLYQQLGGTKTMRQLSQTEKRLLRIYAVFQQMENSGAIGDLAKTMESTSNQMRIMSEGLKELGTWIGIVVEDILRPALPYLNAFVLTMTNIVKAIAQMRGAKPQEFGLVEGLEEANEEAKELTGSLLGFDKFSSLNSGQEQSNIFGIDETLLNAMRNFDSILDDVNGKAQSIAESWTKWWVAEDGGLTKQAKELLDVLEALGITISLLVSYRLVLKVGQLISKVTGLTTAMGVLNFAIATGVVYSIIKAVEAFKKGDIWGGILATTIGVTLVGAFLLLHRTMVTTVLKTIGKTFIQLITNATLATGNFALGLTSLTIGFIGLGASIAGAIALFNNWDILKNWQKIVGIIGVLTTAIFGLALAFGAFHSAWSIGLATGAVIAGIVATSVAIGTAKSQASSPVQVRKTGGMIEDGLFTMNKGEIMGTFDDGTSIVANNQQIISGIEQGVYKAVRSAMSNGSGGDVVIKIDSRELARATASANASALSSKYRVDFQPR